MKIQKISLFFQNIFSVKKRTLFSGILAILGTVFVIAAQYNVSQLTITPTEQTNYKAIVFDLGDVLVTTSKSVQRNIFFPTILKNPSLLYHLISIDIKTTFFELLSQIPACSTTPIYNKGKAMPLIMTDWMVGKKSLTQLRLLAHQQIQQSNYPIAVKQLLIQVSHFMFNAPSLAASQVTIDPMITIAKNFKDAGYKIYILSNWDPYSFELIKEAYPQIFDLCDGMVISGYEQIAKPDEAIFQKLINQYDLNPQECIFIDDEPYNIATAQKLGFTAILQVNPTLTCKELIKCGTMTLTA